MTTEVRRLVAAAVRSELGKQGNTAAWLAERSGLDDGILEAALAARRDLSVTELATIAEALDVSPARLAPPPPPPLPHEG